METNNKKENEFLDEDLLRTTKPAGEFQLYCEIVSYDIPSVSREEHMILKIEFYSYLSKKEWSTNRKLTDFLELYSILEKFFLNVPKLPPKINQPTNNINELVKKKIVLNTFLQSIISRPDLISNIYVVKFLQLENHFADFNIFQPLLLYNIEDLQNEVITMDYDSKTSLLFVGTVNKNFTAKISNYFSKIKLFGNNSKDDNEKGISQLIIYNIIKNNSGQSHFESLFSKSFQNEICYLKYSENKDEGNSILVVGFTNGSFELFKIFINESNNVTRDFIENICTIKVHKKPIIGVAINFTIGYVYSVAKETTLNISELNYQSLMRSVPLTKREINNFFYDEEKLKLYLSDEGGSVWIVDVMSSLQPKILQAFHTKTPNISTLDIDLTNKYLFLGNTKGYLQVFEINDEDLNNITLIRKFDLNLDYHLKITGVKFTLRSEILISLSNGSIAVFSHEEEFPEFVIDAHLKEISKFIWDEKKKILITSSLDKGIKMFQLPLYWPSELVRKYKSKNTKKILLINNHNNTDNKSNEDFEKALEQLENQEQEKESNPFEDVNDKMIKIEQNSEDIKNNEEMKTETTEDEDFLISQSIAKIKYELSESEKNCEDLHGWDEDY